MPKIIPQAKRSAAALLEVLVLLRLLRIDLALHRVGAVFLLFVGARLAGVVGVFTCAC